MERSFIVDSQHHFPKIEGCTLTLNGLFGDVEDHDDFFFRGQREHSEEIITFIFYRVWFVNCITLMTNIHLRMATDAENTGFSSLLSLPHAEHISWLAEQEKSFPVMVDSWPWALRNGRLIIECDQGIYSIWAGGLTVTWMSISDPKASEELYVTKPAHSIPARPLLSSPYLAISDMTNVPLGASLWKSGPPFCDL